MIFVKTKAPTKKQIAAEAVAAAVDTMGEAGGAGDVETAPLQTTSTRKTGRVKADPFMPKGGVNPIEWVGMEDLQEGVRGILVSIPYCCNISSNKSNHPMTCTQQYCCCCVHMYGGMVGTCPLARVFCSAPVGKDRSSFRIFSKWRG